MNAKNTTSDPIHLLGLRAALYGAAVFIGIGPMATQAGISGGLIAVVLGLLAAGKLQARGVRLPVTLAGSGLAMLLGLWMGGMLGAFQWPTRLLGVGPMLSMIDSATFFLLVLGTVTALRSLALRWPAMAVLEVGLVVAVVASLFAPHRDMQIGRPRFLSDWAFGQGRDPIESLVVVGLVTLLAVAVLLLPRQDWRKSLLAMLTLLLFGWAGYALCLGTLKADPLAGAGGKDNQQQESENPFDQPPPEQNKPSPVATVLLHDEYSPYEKMWYFRQNAQSQYNGKHLVRSVMKGLDTDVPGAFPTAKTNVEGVPMPADASKLVSTTVNLVEELARPIGLVGPTSMEPAKNPDPDYFRVTYAVTSRVLVSPVREGKTTDLIVELASRKGGDASWTEEVRQHYLAAPEDARFRELAEKVLREGLDNDKLKDAFKGSPMLRALTLRRYLEANMTYSPKQLEVEDPVVEFLFGSKQGYCVHIAHSMALLLRSVGIPSRVATGYAVDAARVGQGSSIMIQSTDAHAWCEMYLDGVGWIVMDPALENVDPDYQPPSEPDPETARQYSQKAQPMPDEFNNDKDNPEPKAKPEPELTAEEAAARRWRRIAGVSFSVLMVLAAVYMIKAWRRLAPRFGAPHELYRLCYRATLDRLAEVGMRREFGETREEFARRLARQSPELAELTDAHVRRAVGGVDRADRAAWLALQTRATASINRSTPAVRRVTGWLNPVAWMSVR